MSINQAQTWLDARVRELVRERAVDPQRSPEILEELIDRAIDEYEDLTIVGRVTPIVDHDATKQALRDDVGGYGALQQLIDDPTVEEIWINAPDAIFCSRDGRSELTTIVLTDQQVREVVEKMLRASGRRLDLSSPFVDAALLTGERLHVAIPDITRAHWSVNIRKYVVRAHRLTDLVDLQMLSEQAAKFLDAAVNVGMNIIVSGATQAGKTTFLAALLGSVPAGQRVITAEEVFELNLAHRDIVAMQTRPANMEDRGEVSLRRLVRESLRMRPERIVIGEVRQAEAFDLLIALNSGIPGACTIHANSAREAISKLCVLPLLAGENVSASFVVPTVARSVDLVVHVHRDRHGRRRVREILAVAGRVEGDVVESTELFIDSGNGLERGAGSVAHPELFSNAGYNVAELLGGERWTSSSEHSWA